MCGVVYLAVAYFFDDKSRVWEQGVHAIVKAEDTFVGA